MLAVDNHEVEKLAVGAMIASAQGDVAGVAGLLATIEREELIGALAYCARFVVSYARRTAADDAEFVAALQAYAMTLARRSRRGLPDSG